MGKVRILVVLPILHIDPHRLFAFIAFIFIGIADSFTGVTKSKLTIASARELRQADETTDVKKLSAATMMIDGVLNSPTQGCKRWLDLEGRRHGAKSNRKGNK